MGPRLNRLELGLVSIVFAIGFGLRAAYPSRIAIEHFDEGVYASNLYTLDGRYPFQHLYAPPLLPFCLEWAAIFGGPHAVMWVNVLSGSLTLLVLWGMVRQWWGPPAAIAAMVLLAFNEFHIAYSRAALTDAMLGLWMTAGVWAGWRAIQFGGPLSILAAGALASLAWWTKYNGWLTLAITGAGAAGWILFGNAQAKIESPASEGRQPPVNPHQHPDVSSRAKTTAGSRRSLADAPKTNTVFGAARLFLGRWLLTAAIAFLLWSPWLWELQQYGGYAAVAKNHAGYFTGVGQWWANAQQQLAAQWHYVGWLSHFAFMVSCLLPAAWLTWYVARRKGSRPTMIAVMARRAPGLLSAWTIAAWTLGLCISIPLYTPYPRIGLPLVIAAAVLGGLFGKMATADLVPEDPGPGATGVDVPDNQRRELLWFISAFAVLIPMYVSWSQGESAAPQWESRRGLDAIASEVIGRIDRAKLTREIDGVRCVLYVLAEPGLFFHLGAAQRESPIGHIAIPTADYSMAAPGANTSGLPAYIVVGPHAEASHPREANRLIAAGRLELVAEFDYRPSDLVLLDSRPVWKIPGKDNPVIERIRLLHVKP